MGEMRPCWSFVLFAATPSTFGSAQLTDETLEPFESAPFNPAMLWKSALLVQRLRTFRDHGVVTIPQ
jgi:hypothetical protein